MVWQILFYAVGIGALVALAAVIKKEDYED